MSRIVAGSRRGHRLATLPGATTRPTTDRVREALFSAIAAWAGTGTAGADSGLAGRSFCDLYAGSGAVGLEAASRGADRVLLVEADRRAAEVIRRNATNLGLAVDIRTARVEQLLARSAQDPFDVVFADPPYEVAAEVLDGLVAAALGHRWVAPGGLVVLERSKRGAAPQWPASVRESWSRVYGESVLFYGLVADEATSPDWRRSEGPS